MAFQRLRLGALPVLAALVLGTVGISASLVHVIWLNATSANSAQVAADLSGQIADTVKKELAQTISAARGAWGAIRTVLAEKVIASREEDKREFVFLSQMQAQPLMSAITYAWTDNSLFSARRLGDTLIEMTEIKPGEDGLTRRYDQYKVFPGGTEFQARAFEKTALAISDAGWFSKALAADTPMLTDIPSPFDENRRMLAYAGAVEVELEKDGVLAILIDHARLSRFLSTLSVGQGRGAAFILSRDLGAVASPDPGADETSPPLGYEHSKLEVARKALQDYLTAGRFTTIRTSVVDQDGERLSVSVAPLNVLDWHLVVAIPEEFFVGIFRETEQRLAWLVAGLAAAMTLLAALLAHHLVSQPIRSIAADVASIEAFDFDRVVARPSHLLELSALSSVMVRMSRALSAFRKYMPADLVRHLIDTGVEARPGGMERPISVMFADLKGFTALSERQGADVVQALSRFFEIGAQEIAAHGGIVDKFIGDAIMAFWNAPKDQADHAVAACRAALAIAEGLARVPSDSLAGSGLSVRIGINTGEAVVGNIGSPDRLNYTAIGDIVNVASRLEGLNRLFGTTVLIGEETRLQAGDAIVVREIDRVALYGRQGDTRVFELLALSGSGVLPEWVAHYENGLNAYRHRRFVEAAQAFRQVLDARTGDGPAQRLLAQSLHFAATPPPPEWDGVDRMNDKQS